MRYKILFLFLSFSLCGKLFPKPFVYNVLDYGAVADTSVLSTAAIQKAIDECTKNGGGTVCVPSGEYLTTSLLLKNNVNLRLEGGAVLYASRKQSDYRKASDGSALEVVLWARDAQNISVSGTGRIHCRAVRVQYRREPQLVVADSVTGREIANAIKYGVDYQTKYRKVPPCPSAINFINCTNVHINDIEVIESSGWSVHLQWCDRVFVNRIHIQSDSANGVTTDGLDINGCSNVMVSDCVINTGDDAICLKTALHDGIAKPCRWITISNCILTSSSAALKLGTETHADFENITVTNCVINKANRGVNMIIQDGGYVRNVLFSNLIINTVRKATFWWGNGDPVWLTIQNRKNGVPFAGGIENLVFSHIMAHGQSGVKMEGFEGRIKNVRLEDFQLFIEPEQAVDKRARNGFLFYGVDDLSLLDCKVVWDKERPEPAWESAYYFENVNGAVLNRLVGAKVPGGRYPSLRMKNVKNISLDGKILQTTGGMNL